MLSFFCVYVLLVLFVVFAFFLFCYMSNHGLIISLLVFVVVYQLGDVFFLGLCLLLDSCFVD